ncbi:MAG: hypothetical protein HY270_12470 [Deltaproteobacteria bacterium]|nr:hypothetical protein [Deltaproteobacteria bacterium]
MKRWLLTATLLFAGCATLPSGPSVMVLPGDGKDFEQFRLDDMVCRDWADRQVGTNTKKIANENVATGAAVGTVLGAAGGAAIGAAAGNPAMGAAVGSGVGLLGGSAAGADNASRAQWSVQRRYDVAYMQCMYAKGNQIPVSGGFQRVPNNPPPAPAPPRRPSSIPPPPPGAPPPPPPDATR